LTSDVVTQLSVVITPKLSVPLIRSASSASGLETPRRDMLD